MTSDQQPVTQPDQQPDQQPGHHGVEVSLAEVAAEDPREVLADEADLLDEDPGDDAAGLESTDTPPEQPELSSMLGVGPVAEGDEPVI